jgi:hypothetical protein
MRTFPPSAWTRSVDPASWPAPSSTRTVPALPSRPHAMRLTSAGRRSSSEARAGAGAEETVGPTAASRATGATAGAATATEPFGGRSNPAKREGIGEASSRSLSAWASASGGPGSLSLAPFDGPNRDGPTTAADRRASGGLATAPRGVEAALSGRRDVMTSDRTWPNTCLGVDEGSTGAGVHGASASPVRGGFGETGLIARPSDGQAPRCAKSFAWIVRNNFGAATDE